MRYEDPNHPIRREANAQNKFTFSQPVVRGETPLPLELTTKDWHENLKLELGAPVTLLMKHRRLLTMQVISVHFLNVVVYYAVKRKACDYIVHGPLFQYFWLHP